MYAELQGHHYQTLCADVRIPKNLAYLFQKNLLILYMES